MSNKTKVEKQRELMQNIEKKLIAFADAGRIMEEKFLEELSPNKIEKFFNSLKLSNSELSNIQVVAFSRMVQAEQRLDFLRHAFSEILTELWQLKQAVEAKQSGGPKRKVPLAIAARVYTEIGSETKKFPRKDEFTQRLNHVLTGSRTANEEGEFVVSEKTIDNYMGVIKAVMVELYIQDSKLN